MRKKFSWCSPCKILYIYNKIYSGYKNLLFT